MVLNLKKLFDTFVQLGLKIICQISWRLDRICGPLEVEGHQIFCVSPGWCHESMHQVWLRYVKGLLRNGLTSCLATSPSRWIERQRALNFKMSHSCVMVWRSSGPSFDKIRQNLWRERPFKGFWLNQRWRKIQYGGKRHHRGFTLSRIYYIIRFYRGFCTFIQSDRQPFIHTFIHYTDGGVNVHLDTQLGGAAADRTSNLQVTSQPAVPPHLLLLC